MSFGGVDRNPGLVSLTAVAAGCGFDACRKRDFDERKRQLHGAHSQHQLHTPRVLARLPGFAT